MKNKFIVILMFLLTSFVYSHTLLLNVFDNEDNTITVEGVFSTGETAPGAQIRLESLSSGEILYKKRLPEESELIIDIPKESYKVILNGGPGHQIIKDGISPKEGFQKLSISKNINVTSSNPSNNKEGISEGEIILFSILIALLLLIITIFISIKNTNRLIYELKHLNKRA